VHPLGAERDGAGGQDRERDRQVERRAFLAGVGWRKVDRYLAVGKFVAGIFDRRLGPLLGLAARPTVVSFGIPPEMSTSTSTGKASTPASALERTLADTR
jgi:hypothetical protein